MKEREMDSARWKEVKWDRRLGVVEVDSGKQLLQITSVNCSGKFRNAAGKELVNKLNTIARGARADDPQTYDHP